MINPSQSKIIRDIKALRISIALLSFVIALVIQSIAFAEPPQGAPRKIVSDDFTRNRQEAVAATASNKTSQGGSNNSASLRPRSNRRTYRLASQPAIRTRPSSTTVIAQLGITIWRLRPARPADTGTRQLLREKAENSEWVPERVEAGAVLQDADRVRISIESPSVGYLYIVDRDLFSGDRGSEIKLIFPLLGEDNYVAPGKLVELPALESDPNYFTARPKPKQIGEMLTLIVTSKPLTELPLSNEELLISRVQLRQWEKTWGGAAEVWEMEGGAGEAWTQEEQQAAARKGARQLTRDDPAPQTIYRVSTTDNKALLVNVRLRYAK